MIKKFFKNLYRDAEFVNSQNIKYALKKYGPFEALLDVGCWDGTETIEWAKAGNVKNIYGIEVVDSVAKKANLRGIKTHTCYADRDKWPIKDKSIDCIVTNQVIEHLTDLDHFFSEASRVLITGGYLITSTNNLSSIHNIFSLFCGWSPFDLSNSSKKQLGIGNPLSLNKEMLKERGDSWLHKCVYTVRWLKDWQSLYGFEYKSDYGCRTLSFSCCFWKIFKII